MSTEVRGQVIHKARLASLAGVTLKTVDDWVRRGLPVLSKGGHGRPWEIDSAAAWDWIIAFRAGPEGATPEAERPLDLATERARESKERADKYALENAVSRRELVPAEDVADLWQRMRSRAADALRGLPDHFQAAGLISAAQHAATLELVDEALEELAGSGVPAAAQGDDAPAV